MIAITQDGLLDVAAGELRRLFAGYDLKDSAGQERKLNIYKMELPVRDYEDDAETPPPEPYILVRIRSCGIAEEGDPQKIELLFVVCVFDEDKYRQGWRDALRIVNEIYRHYAVCNRLGRRWLVRYPISWALPDDNPHPYYFAGLSLNVEAPTIRKELPEC